MRGGHQFGPHYYWLKGNTFFWPEQEKHLLVTSNLLAQLPPRRRESLVCACQDFEVKCWEGLFSKNKAKSRKINYNNHMGPTGVPILLKQDGLDPYLSWNLDPFNFRFIHISWMEHLLPSHLILPHDSSVEDTVWERFSPAQSHPVSAPSKD